MHWRYCSLALSHLCCLRLNELEQLECLRSKAASWLPILLSHIGSQVKRRQRQSYKFKEIAKISNFWILTHLLKLLDKICKYEMDPTSIIEDTERTRFCPQTDRRTRWNQYTPVSTSLTEWDLNKLGHSDCTSSSSLESNEAGDSLRQWMNVRWNMLKDTGMPWLIFEPVQAYFTNQMSLFHGSSIN